MKKLFISLIVVLAFTANLSAQITVNQVNAQTVFAPIGAEWIYSDSPVAWGHDVYRIVSEKDTVIEGSNCRILKWYYDTTSAIASNEYIIKQEGGKVFYYTQNKFHQLFDFDAEVNDTVSLAFKYRIYNEYRNNHDYSYKDSALSARYVIENIRIDTISSVRNGLKVFTAKILDEDQRHVGNKGVLPWNYEYIEKLGFGYEFMPVVDNSSAVLDVVPYMGLMRYSEPDFSERWVVAFSPCYYCVRTSVSTLKTENSINIYPNPINDIVSVFAKSNRTVEITDISGKTVYKSVLTAGVNQISTKHLPKGIYLVKILNKDYGIEVLKIIKP